MQTFADNDTLVNLQVDYEKDMLYPILGKVASSGKDYAVEENTYYYHGNHLGSMSWITDGYGKIVEHRAYLPYGETWYERRTDRWWCKYTERFRFTGKERDEESGYDYFGARYYDPTLLTSWMSVDPVVKYNESPYLYCGGNPMRNVDGDGRDWYEETGQWDANLTSPTCGQYIKGGIKWTDATNQTELGDRGTYLGKAVLEMQGSRDEKLGKNQNLFAADTKAADATFYGPDGTRTSGKGLTMSSDYSLFGAIESGDYNVSYEKPGKSAPLPSNWKVRTLLGSDWIPELDGKPNFSKGISKSAANYGTPYKTGEYVHSVNKSGKAGAWFDNGWHAISTGCPVVESRLFNKIDNSMKGAGYNNFRLRIAR